MLVNRKLAPLISVQNLCLMRSGKTIVSSLSFDIYSGEALLLSGANGVGKTSLLRALAGLVTLSSGGLVYQNKPLDLDNSETVSDWNATIGWLGVEESLKPSDTPNTALAYAAALAGFCPDDLQQRIIRTIDEFDLSLLANEECQKFSTGQKRRLALARLALIERQIWLMDEPTIGLDCAARSLLLRRIDEKLEQGGTIIIASHEAIEDLMIKRDKIPTKWRELKLAPPKLLPSQQLSGAIA